MNLHLLSTPGDRDIGWVLEACRPYLEDRDDPTVAFLPLAWLNVNHWLDYTARSFAKLARIELIDTERMDLSGLQTVTRGADYPQSWTVNAGRGRTFYTTLGHRDDIWTNDPVFRAHVTGGIRWALGIES